MEMGRRGTIPEDNHVFNQCWRNLWNLPGQYNKLQLREVTALRKFVNWIKDRGKGGGGGLQTSTKDTWVTHHRGAPGCEIQNSINNLDGKTNTYIYGFCACIAMVKGMDFYT